MKLTLHVWRQAGPSARGRFVRYDVPDGSPDMSFLELLDVLNQQLIARKEEPIAFDHDCREGICGACVAACPNASAMLFVAAKVSHLGLLPQGQPERDARVMQLVAQMDAEGFGACSNHGECMAACPKEISIDFIARLNRDYIRGTFL